MKSKAHPSRNLHAKVYISRYKEGDRDYGNVITGSSNFSESGLLANCEFNVQLKNSQGNSSLSWFSIFCSLNNIKLNVKELEKQQATEITMADRMVKVLLAYSPSRLSRVTTEKLIDSYSKMLFESATLLPN